MELDDNKEVKKVFDGCLNIYTLIIATILVIAFIQVVIGAISQ